MAMAAPSTGRALTRNGGTQYPDWIAEARIHGLPITGLTVDTVKMGIDLDRALAQGANVIEADSRLSDYLDEADFDTELSLITESVKQIHAKGLKVVVVPTAPETISIRSWFEPL